MARYPVEILGEDEDNGTMVDNVETLADAVIGHKIVKVEKDAEVPLESQRWGANRGFHLTLDNGTQVWLVDTNDCCAYTSIDADKLIEHLDRIDHVILGVGTTGGYSNWHIYCALGDVLELAVDWSPGNAFYYGYGFNITVLEGEPLALDLPSPYDALLTTNHTPEELNFE